MNEGTPRTAPASASTSRDAAPQASSKGGRGFVSPSFGAGGTEEGWANLGAGSPNRRHSTTSKNKASSPGLAATKGSTSRGVSDKLPEPGTPTPAPVAISTNPGGAPLAVLQPEQLDQVSRLVALPLFVFAAAVSAFLYLNPELRDRAVRHVSRTVSSLNERFSDSKALAARAPSPAPLPAPAPLVPAAPRADEKLQHEGYGWIPGGVLFTPPTLQSADGTYDLVLHFHGNTRVVAESVEHAGLNAAVAVVNLGIGSGVYEEAYAVPGTYEALLETIRTRLAERGLANPKLRRVALSSWSAGYGAIGTILRMRRGTDPLDAVLVLDGIHSSRLPGKTPTVDPRNLGVWVNLAKNATAGQLLFSITHAEIDPVTYAGTNETADYLLQQVGATRGEPGEAPEHVSLRAAEGAVSKKAEKSLVPVSEARTGTFHVRGFTGNTPEHHMAHLLQMTSTVVPELQQRWGKPLLERSLPNRATASR